MKIAVFSRTDSAVLRRAPSIEARTDRAACREAQEYQRMVVEMLREEYGDDFIGTPPSDGSGGECNKRGEGVRMCHHFEAEALQIDTDNKPRGPDFFEKPHHESLNRESKEGLASALSATARAQSACSAASTVADAECSTESSTAGSIE